ncbi:hypothetical protein DPMN_162972 [Dreissena polymorpha]|uniref:Uncharacterized protein n=1 Tax=Dreissena polymorpha TaxID=45954 RepID=A0A9D4ERA5_DREPO|nr:hypothetical protein DPMN_162972 [Dreissena polymorpha]
MSYDGIKQCCEQQVIVVRIKCAGKRPIGRHTRPSRRVGLKHTFHSAHNEYLLQLRASNRLQDDMKVTLPQVLEELDEICIDTTNTVNVAIESHSLLLLTKANEQRRQLENLLRCCRQVNPMLDISLFVKAINSEEHKIPLQRHKFSPADPMANSGENQSWR